MSLVVRVVAPTGRDAELIVGVLREHGLAAEAVSDIPLLFATHLAEPIGPLLLTEESLTPSVVAAVSRQVQDQPDWSDFPVVILTSGGRETLRSRALEAQRSVLGSPVLLERPIRTSTLVASLRAAVRARERQYQVRAAFINKEVLLAELNAEREQLRVILDSTPAGVFVVNKLGEVIIKNPAVERIAGRSLPPTIPHPTWEVRRSDGTVVADEDLPARRVLCSGEAVPAEEYQYLRNDGTSAPVSVAASPIFGTDGQVESVVVAITDLSQQKRSETALIQSEKLAAVGRLAASISHEINNPLEAITNLLYLLREDVQLEPQARTYLSMAESELARVSQIASQTLRFHRQATHARLINPEELLDSVVALYQGRLLNSNIKLEFQHRGALPVLAMEGDMRQVLNNLVANAIDSMRGGGRLILRTRNSYNWRTGQPGMRIIVADDGHGMSDEVRRRVFEAFYTTKGINGTGLGLWISHGIIEKHHGKLLVRSCNKPPFTGTVFSIFLPRDTDPIV